MTFRSLKGDISANEKDQALYDTSVLDREKKRMRLFSRKKTPTFIGWRFN